MKETKIALDQFDLAEFVKEMLKYMEHGVSTVLPTRYLFRASDGSILDKYRVDDSEDFQAKRDIVSELTFKNKLLFFPFGACNVGDPIPCADGNKYLIEEGADFSFGEVDCVGYLVNIKNGVVTLNSALNACDMGLCNVYIFDDCGVFEKPMMDFLKKFIKK